MGHPVFMVRVNIFVDNVCESSSILETKVNLKLDYHYF